MAAERRASRTDRVAASIVAAVVARQETSGERFPPVTFAVGGNPLPVTIALRRRGVRAAAGTDAQIAAVRVVGLR